MVARRAISLMAVLLLIGECVGGERPSLKIPGKRNFKKIPSLKLSSSSSIPVKVKVKDVSGSHVVPEDNFVFPRYIFTLGKDSKYPKYPLRPGEDTVYPHVQPKKTKFPMPHLYSGDLYAHEDGDAFIAQDDAHLIDEEYDFEKSAAQTDRFIPYTYIIELKETYEDDLSPQSSQSFSTLDPAMQHHIKNLHANEHKPRLKSEEVLKKVEIFIEKGYDRGAYDHKGFEDHTSAFDKYNEHTEGRYGGSSSSRTRESESFHEHQRLPDDAGDYPYQALGRSGTSHTPVKYHPFGSKKSPRHCGEKRISTCHPRKQTKNVALVIPTFQSKQQSDCQNDRSNRKGFANPAHFKRMNNNKNNIFNTKKNSVKSSHQQKSSSNVMQRAPIKQFAFPSGFFPNGDNLFNRNSFFPASKDSTISATEARSLPISLDKLFAFPVYSSTYDNFHSKHTIPAFPFNDQQIDASNYKTDPSSQFRQRSKRRPINNPMNWDVPKSTTANLIHLRTNKILNPQNIFETRLPSSKAFSSAIKESKLSPFHKHNNHAFDLHLQKASSIGRNFGNERKQELDLAREIGQPIELLRKEPCISPTPLTANFEFGKFKPKLGPPDWFESEPHFLDPLKGQVDRLREAVYEPVLKEALCL